MAFKRLDMAWLTKPMNSGPYRSWLIERSSLTRRLQRASGAFAVKPVLFCKCRALPEEGRLLKLRPWQKAWVREVYLDCNHVPAVFAHSVLPFSSLSGRWQGLGRLGSRSLGTALFSDPRVKRTPLAYKKLASRHPLYGKAVRSLSNPPSALWARRSVFFLGDSAIMVTEIFLPQVLTL